MPSSDFKGFPRRVRYIPVPNPMFGPLLEQIDDLSELKCTLRSIWLLHQKKGHPRFITLTELLADRVLASALTDSDTPHRLQVERAANRAVQRGTLITGNVERNGTRDQLFMLNTESDRKAMSEIVGGWTSEGPIPETVPWQGPVERQNIFALYEDNIGMLSPIIAEQLKEAEELYPSAWIEDAFLEAVSHNKRSWRYIARILERWEREGRADGEPGRHLKKAGYY